MDTIGDFIDRLTIANIRLWYMEDERRVLAKKMDDEELTSEMNHDELLETQRTVRTLMKSIAEVNRERNDLIDKINGGLQVLLDKTQGKDTSLRLTVQDLLGTKKNKFYKVEDHT